MEYLAGQTLGDWQHKKTWREIVAVYRQAGAGLAAAHACGLVHRDFKPENALVTSEGRVVVLDFGLARPSSRTEQIERPMDPTHDALSTELTSGRLVGTPAYMSPEQFMWEEADAQSDQFAYCVSLYEALYGERPFAGDTLQTLRQAVLLGELRAPPSDTKVPSWIRQIVVRGLATTREQRWPALQDLLTALANDPWRKRLAWTSGLVVLAIILSVWGVRSWQQIRYEANCRQAGQQVYEHWSSEVGERISAAFTASTIAYAPSTSQKLLPRIDGWATTWQTTRADTCIANRETSVDHRQRTDTCLGDALEEFATLLDTYEHPTDRVIRIAIQTVVRLPDPARCADPDYLRLHPLLPDDPTLRASVLDLKKLHRQFLAEHELGHRERSAAIAQQLLDRAQALAWQPTIETAMFTVADTHITAGNYELAAERFADVFYSAGAAGRDLTALSAARRLAGVNRVNAQLQQGLIWAKTAAMLRTRVGIGEHTIEAAEIDFTTGQIYRDLDQLDRSLALFERALDTFRTQLDADHPRLRSVYLELGNVEFLREHFAEAKELYARAREVSEAAFGRDHPHVAQSLGSLGNVALKTGDLQTAVTLMERARELFESSYGKNNDTVITCLLNLGEIHVELGQLDAAADVLGTAHERILASRGRGHPDIGDILVSLAQIDLKQGSAADAVPRYTTAIDIFQAVPGRSRESAHALHGLAATHMLLREYETARRVVARGLELTRAGGLETRHKLLHTRCRIELALHEHAAAGQTLQQIFALQKKSSLDEVDGPETLLLAAQLALAEGEVDRAKHADERLQAHLGTDSPLLEAEALYFQAQLAAKSGKRGRAQVLAKRARDKFAAADPRYQVEVEEIRAFIANL